MKGVKLGRQGGYTIVEVMIVLAVSGFMFVIAAQAINGKVDKAEFTTGVNTYASQIQSTIEQVSDGQYQDLTVSCTAPTSTADDAQVTILPGTTAQGNNSNCIFAGKLLQLVTSQSETYDTYTIAASRTCANNNTLPTTGSCSTSPTFPYAYTGLTLVNGQGGSTPLTTTQGVPQGLDISAMCITTTSQTCSTTHNDLSINNYLLGFVEDFGSVVSNDTGNSNLSGAQGGLSLIALADTNGDTDIATTFKPSTSLQVLTGACIGLTDGNQYAEIDIGQNGTSSSTGAFQVTIQHDDSGADQCNS